MYEFIVRTNSAHWPLGRRARTSRALNARRRKSNDLVTETPCSRLKFIPQPCRRIHYREYTNTLSFDRTGDDWRAVYSGHAWRSAAFGSSNNTAGEAAYGRTPLPTTLNYRRTSEFCVRSRRCQRVLIKKMK